MNGAASAMRMQRFGSGEPLLLVHGLGGSWRSWAPVIDALAERRDLIAVDLPGFGASPPLDGEVSIATLADTLSDFLQLRGLIGIDAVGSSVGARLVLELARRGCIGSAVALAPGGFWRGWERAFFHRTIGLSVKLVRLLQPLLPWLTEHALGRALLFAQLSARPWAVDARLALDELRGYAVSPSFDELLDSLVHGPDPFGAAVTPGPVTIGWGRSDHVCLPRQAQRALECFPHARLHWFDRCGHFPQWDRPEACARLILRAIGEPVALPDEAAREPIARPAAANLALG